MVALCWQIFTGPSSKTVPMKQKLATPLKVFAIMVNPQTYSGNDICMRIELYGYGEFVLTIKYVFILLRKTWCNIVYYFLTLELVSYCFYLAIVCCNPTIEKVIINKTITLVFWH